MFSVINNNLDFTKHGRSCWLFTLTMALVFIGYGLEVELFSLLAHQRHLTVRAMSLMASLHFVGFYFTAVFSPFIVKRMGYGYAYLASILGLAVGILVLSLAQDIVSFGVGRLLIGSSIALFYATLDGWINEIYDNTRRGQAFGYYSFISYLSMMIGAYLLCFNHVVSENSLLFLATGFVCAGAGFTLFLSPVPCVSKTSNYWRLSATTLLTLSRKEPLSIASITVMSMATAPFWDLGSLFAREAPVSLNIATFIMMFTLGSALSQWPFGKISDIIGRKQSILVIAMLGMLACLIMLSLSMFPILQQAFIYYAASFFYGFCTSPLYIISAAYIFDYVKKTGGNLIDVPSWYLIFYGLGGFMGSSFNACIMSYWPSQNALFLPGLAGNIFLILLGMCTHKQVFCWQRSVTCMKEKTVDLSRTFEGAGGRENKRQK